ncbi:stathmin domain-containing protein 1 [Lampris incognitus]|uniref:stathmin domain-containing protein 1 n=1 Tax=Lampris incognitus TaxID=2546036 RepID=UPI0024B5700D|nr:stathmin domain-containing protein 1 [Lampris incognitus]
MGCGVSKTTVVQPINPNELQREEDETASKHGGRGDSAVSKVTTDSGVVMESRDVLGSPGIERLKSSEILEQLLSQGILLVGERNSKAGEAYNIMLDDKELPRRRPPARLESLKVRKEQSPTSREAIDHKMRLAEERRMVGCVCPCPRK